MSSWQWKEARDALCGVFSEHPALDLDRTLWHNCVAMQVVQITSRNLSGSTITRLMQFAPLCQAHLDEEFQRRLKAMAG